MKAVRLRLVVALLTFFVGLALTWFVNTSQLVEKALGYPVRTFDNYLSSPVEVPPRRFTDYSPCTEVILEPHHLRKDK